MPSLRGATPEDTRLGLALSWNPRARVGERSTSVTAEVGGAAALCRTAQHRSPRSFGTKALQLRYTPVTRRPGSTQVEERISVSIKVLCHGAAGIRPWCGGGGTPRREGPSERPNGTLRLSSRSIEAV